MSEKTVYPGAPVNMSGYQQSSNFTSGFHAEPGSVKSSNEADSSKKPILGFLYSVSKDYSGEYWPLYLGANTIGRGEDCSVSLKEGTVSQRHATLVIRQMQNQGEDAGLFVFIQDVGSMCGTLVNGVTLDFNPKECKNGDIITIGENYELYFILVDPKSIGLSPKDKFKEIASPTVQDEWTAPVSMFPGNVNKGTLSGDASTSLEGRMATIYKPQR